jgi:hypothetical protein
MAYKIKRNLLVSLYVHVIKHLNDNYDEVYVSEQNEVMTQTYIEQRRKCIDVINAYDLPNELTRLVIHSKNIKDYNETLRQLGRQAEDSTVYNHFQILMDIEERRFRLTYKKKLKHKENYKGYKFRIKDLIVVQMTVDPFLIEDVLVVGQDTNLEGLCIENLKNHGK